MSGSKAQEQAAYNQMARNMVLATGVECTVLIQSSTVNSALTPTFSYIPRNVGILRGFTIVVRTTINTPAGVTLNRTEFGPANLLSRVQFNDLNNNVRVNTTGWHLSMIAAARRERLAGSSFTTDNPMAVSAVNPIVAPVSIAPSQSNVPLSYIYEVPVAYGMDDLRGAIYAAVVSANMNLTLNLNPIASIVVPAANDGINAVYKQTGAGTVSIGNFTIDVYQHYIDQLPMGNQGPIIPLVDMATLYMYQDTNQNGLSVGQDFGIPYANFRDFLSTTLIYDNAGVMNSGTDINYFALQAANFTNIWKKDVRMQSYEQRNRFQTDLPNGVYFFDSRRKPISTVQFGNMQLNINPSAVTAGAQCLIGFESFGQLGQVVGAASLATG